MSEIIKFDQQGMKKYILQKGYCDQFQDAQLGQQINQNPSQDIFTSIRAINLLNEETLAEACAGFVEGCYISDTYNIQLSKLIFSIDARVGMQYQVLPIRYQESDAFLVVNVFNETTVSLISDWSEANAYDFCLVICSERVFSNFVAQNQSTFSKTGIKSHDEITILLENILKTAITCRASDIRMFTNGGVGEITFRVDGDLVEYQKFDQDTIQRLFAIVEDPKFTRVTDTNRKVPRAGKMDISIDEIAYEIRVNFIPSKNGMDINLRFMNKDNFDLTQLGATPARETMFRQIIERDRGMVLFTGATGSGKSSTAYSMLEIAKAQNTICSAEDPVEHKMQGIVQVDISPQVNYETAIESFLRHDPDIIFIGEIRSPAVAASAFRAANTGHLLLSSVHTNSATATISRLRDLGVSNVDICESLCYVISQKLVKRACKECTTVKVLTGEQLAQELGLPSNCKYITDAKYSVRTQGSCSSCNGQGTHGRCLVSEVLEVDDEIREMILHSDSAMDIRLQASGVQLHPFEESIIQHLKDGTIRLEDAKLCMRG